ncbi:MAG: hypothetical protein U0556_11160 [Dehalococcoidia bacterium]
MDTDAFLNLAARRARREPKLLGSLLARYQEQGNLSDIELAEELDASEQAMTILALCGRPRPDRFQADVLLIAERTGISRFRLAGVLRKAEAVDALRQVGGGLRAARRREDDKPTEDAP